MRDVAKIKGLLLVLVLSLFLPTMGYAQEEETQVGIGFSQAEPPGRSSQSPAPANNVLPLTSTTQGADKVFPARTGTLPKTGDNQTNRLRIVGLICLMICYWLFLFFRMKEEEPNDEKS